MTAVLSTNNLTKKYRNHQVLNGISLNIEKGSVYGLLGPNGSGKTTTLAILLDIIPQNSGTFEWFGSAPSADVRKQVGAILESPNFYGYLSAENNLKITADIKNISYSDIERVLNLVDLNDRRKDKFKTFSLGMKQRLAIAAALLGNPGVLILDEPTNGLDPQGIVEIRELIKTIAKEGITIILASHMLDEVEKVCTHVGIIKKGNLLVQGKVSDILVDKDKDEDIILVQSENPKLESELKKLNFVKSVNIENNLFTVKFSQKVSPTEINQTLFNSGIVLSHLSAKRKTLETQFLEITN